MSGSSSVGQSASASAVSTPINAGTRPDSAPAFGSSQASTPPNAASSSSSAGGKFLGISGWNDSSPKIDAGFPDKQSNNDITKLNRKESYKAQRKNYRREKKRVASELLNSLQDPAVIVLADWLKIRGTLKSWTKLWCVLKPGLLFIYKSPKTKSSHWVGTVLLTSCQVIERPSKKDGFCFKLFHPMDQTIWAPRGPDKETMGAVVQPLPTSYLIFRAPSQAAGKCWMDALELSLRCSALLVRSVPVIDTSTPEGATSTHETQWSEADYEKHFDEHVPKLKEHLNYLMKYLPPSPPDSKHLHVEPIESFHRSPCPSPTPIFQQLYLAVAHWERYLRDSPDLPRTLSPPGTDDDVFDENDGFSIGRRRGSLQVGYSPGPRGKSVESTDEQRQRRRSSPAEFNKECGTSGITIRISDSQC